MRLVGGGVGNVDERELAARPELLRDLGRERTGVAAGAERAARPGRGASRRTRPPRSFQAAAAPTPTAAAAPAASWSAARLALTRRNATARRSFHGERRSTGGAPGDGKPRRRATSRCSLLRRRRRQRRATARPRRAARAARRCSSSLAAGVDGRDRRRRRGPDDDRVELLALLAEADRARLELVRHLVATARCSASSRRRRTGSGCRCAQMSPWLPKATVAIEDRRFYAARRARLRRHRPRGASPTSARRAGAGRLDADAAARAQPLHRPPGALDRAQARGGVPRDEARAAAGRRSGSSPRT